ncbi:MAG: thioredoxin domain-containing protein [Nitrospira sp.]
MEEYKKDEPIKIIDVGADQNIDIKKDIEFVKENGVFISIAISIIALGMGIYNSYQIQNGGVVAKAGGVKTPALEKILKELPENVPVIGNPEAKLTIVEMADFQCPFCGRFHRDTLSALKQKYIDTGKVKFVYLDYAFLGQESRDASEAAKCASEQGKFWEYHDQLYNNQNGENQGNFNLINFKKYATAIGLDVAKFESCVADTRYDKQIADELALGKKYGVNGTPAFIIGKQFINGASPLANFEQVIDSQLK